MYLVIFSNVYIFFTYDYGHKLTQHTIGRLNIVCANIFLIFNVCHNGISHLLINVMLPCVEARLGFPSQCLMLPVLV